ncbi:MAG: hypothetical protein ACTHM2_17635 [Afipia sp.]
MREIPLARDESAISPAFLAESRHFCCGQRASENEAEHHHEKRRRDRVVEPVVCRDGVDDFHEIPNLKTGNSVAASWFPDDAFFCEAVFEAPLPDKGRVGAMEPNSCPAVGQFANSLFSRSGDPMRRKFHDWMVGSDPYVLGLAGDAVLAVLTAGVITGSIRLIVGFL